VFVNVWCLTTTVPQGCDASVIIVSSGNNTSEKDNPANKSLAGDGFDTVIQAKAAVDAVPQCANQVSCADILTMATRDVIALVRALLSFLSRSTKKSIGAFKEDYINQSRSLKAPHLHCLCA
jgi:hypothetical protein